MNESKKNYDVPISGREILKLKALDYNYGSILIRFKQGKVEVTLQSYVDLVKGVVHIQKETLVDGQIDTIASYIKEYIEDKYPISRFSKNVDIFTKMLVNELTSKVSAAGSDYEEHKFRLEERRILRMKQ